MTINLHLPKGWGMCNTEELECIASAIITEQQRAGRFRSFDWDRVKLMAVLAINNISIISSEADSDTYLVKRPQDKEPWEINTGHLTDLCSRIDWIADQKATMPIIIFPYPELEVKGKRSKVKGSIILKGPQPFLDGYTWQDYRCLTDWMQVYIKLQNARADTTETRNQFLAALFRDSNDKMVDADVFTNFSLIQWQVVLFWWSSLMQLLAKKFPKVFKPEGKSKGKKSDSTPWDFYNQVTASIQKYVGGLSEKDVNSATYGTILQQLEMMADEAAEMDKIKKSHKQ